MKIYLDACCLNRPFDDQSQPRVHLEAEAILLIFEKLRQQEWHWTASEVLLYEINQNPDLENKQRVLSLISMANHMVEITDDLLTRAEELEGAGFDTYDAIHLASAKQAKVDVFLTTDDPIVKIANRNKKLLDFRVENPVKWLEEVLK
ncbi:MAG: PIN domain-containing protein [Chloroflexi bacterium]|nr:PIN domain-containing protein [Chloroflexota bacterium]